MPPSRRSPAAERNRSADLPTPAAWTRRAAAFGLDGIILWCVLLGLATLAWQLSATAPRDGEPLPAAGPIALLTSVAGAAYFALSWQWLGATPGQRLLGMYVGDARASGRLGFGRSLARWVTLGGPLWIGVVVLPALAGLIAGLAAAGWTLLLCWTTLRAPDGRGLHDRLSSSRVARRPLDVR